MLIHPLGLQQLEHLGEHHVVKGCHIIIVQDACSLIPTVSHVDCISSFINPMVDSPVISGR